jgi:dihydrofolate synthase/folylpolyglutamate synthase
MTQKNNTAYQQAYEYLFSFIDFSLTHQEQIAPERFELERMFELMALLSDPQNSYPAIHIAGTKGKGSVSALSAAALQAAGYRTGLYTSPHLHDFRERIQVNGVPIAEADFVRQIEKLQAVADDLPGITSYELQTALAFLHFAAQKVDCAVVEVGMGGRLDSTNILTPLVSIIANISYDHTFVLGETLGEIAAEKGGIIKPGVPVVVSPQQPEALAVLRRIAAAQQAPMTLVGEDIEYALRSHSLSGQEIRLWWTQDERSALELEVGLLGPHQVENAAAAFAASDGLPLSEEALQTGFKNVHWPGRFEVYSGTPTIIFDGAHNRYSAHVLAQTMKDYFDNKPYVLVFGSSEDKDISGMFEELFPGTSALVLVRADHPRAATLNKLRGLAEDFPHPIWPISKPQSALDKAMSLAKPDGLVLVTGSLYMVGQLRHLWLQNKA